MTAAVPVPEFVTTVDRVCRKTGQVQPQFLLRSSQYLNSMQPPKVNKVTSSSKASAQPSFPIRNSDKPTLATTVGKGAISGHLLGQSGGAVFRIAAPAATCVKLAGDFTDWDQRPVDLVRGAGGVWPVTVPLSPGRYRYRYLVDGSWSDDPECPQCEANPFGGRNCVVEVAPAR